jgi:type IV secretory pathway VirB4 component
MTIQEYIENMVKNPDSIASLAVEATAEAERIENEISSFNAKKEEYEKKIRELQDSNMKLFLSVTGKEPEKTEEEEKKPLTRDELASILRGEENGN